MKREELFPKKEEIYSWICDLSQWGHRKTGTPEGRKSAEYIADKFREFGLQDTKIEEVPAVFMNVDVCVLTVDGETVECFAGNATNRGGETGVFESGMDGALSEIVYIGDGTEEDIAGLDLAGKLVLSHIRFTEFSGEAMLELFGDAVDVYDPKGKLHARGPEGQKMKKYNIYSPGTFPANYLRAKAKGAVGFIGILDDYYDDPYWYNEDYTDMLPELGKGYMDMPAVWISRSSGKKLIAKAKSTPPLNGNLKIRSDYDYRTALNVSGKLLGKSDEIILVHSHHDAVFSGAVQDASGISEMLALARYFSRIPEEEREKTMMFAATDTHFADYVAHEAFVRQRHANGEKLVLDLCIEHIGKESYMDDDYVEHVTDEPESRLVYISSPELYDTVMEMFEKYDLDNTVFFEVETGKGIDSEENEEYEYADDEVITDAYYFNYDGTPVVSMVAGQLYLYHPSDKPDRIPVDQLEPVGKAFAGIAEKAAEIL